MNFVKNLVSKHESSTDDPPDTDHSDCYKFDNDLDKASSPLPSPSPAKSDEKSHVPLHVRDSSLPRSQGLVAKRALQQQNAVFSAANIPIRRSSTFFNSKILFTDDPYYDEDPPAPKAYHTAGGTIPEMPKTAEFQRIRSEIDIVRITNQIIVCGNISSSSKSSKKSRVNFDADLAQFLSARYGHKFMIWNLNKTVNGDQAELEYNPQLFRNQVQHIDMQATYCVNLQALFEVCQSIETWLEIDGRHVAVIHCIDGCMRSSLAAACYLKFSEKFETTGEAFEYFCARRCPSDTSWINCLHRKYLHYFNDVLSLHGKVPQPRVLSLKSLICTSIPYFGGGSTGLRPVIEIFECGELIYSIALYNSDTDGRGEVSFKLNKSAADYLTTLDGFNMVLQVPKMHKRLSQLERDIQIVISHAAKTGHEHMLTCIFHTGFVRPNLWRLEARDLYIMSQNKHRYPSDFYLDLVLEESPNTEKRVGYEQFTGLGKLKGLVKLSFYHIVRPEQKLIKALQEANYDSRLSQFALQLYNNEIHDAHAYLREFLLSSEFCEGFTKDLIEAKKHILKKKASQTSINPVAEAPRRVESLGRKSSKRQLDVRQSESSDNSPLDSVLTQHIEPRLEATLVTEQPEIISATVSNNKQEHLSSADLIIEKETAANYNNTENELDLSSLTRQVEHIDDSLSGLRAIQPVNVDGDSSGSAQSINFPQDGSIPPPPPPPPFGLPGGPPPPPPPPGTPGFAPADPNKPRMRSKLNWSEIAHSKNVSRNSVWAQAMQEINLAKSSSNGNLAQAGESPNASFRADSDAANTSQQLALSMGHDDVKRFEEMFCVVPGQVSAAVGRLNASNGSQQKPKETLYFLDMRRAQNMGIALARFTRRDLSMNDLYRGLLSMNASKTLDVEDVQTLQSLMPTTEEKKQVAKFLGSKGEEAKALEFETSEQLVLLVMRDPNLPHYMDALLFTSGFDAECSSVRSNLEALADCYRVVHESGNLKIVLKAVLEVGHLAAFEYGPQSTRSWGIGQLPPPQSAVGFKVGSLVRLMEVKSNDGRLTLLDFLVQTLWDKTPDALEVSSELSSVQQLRHLNAADLDAQGRLLESGISRLKTYQMLPTSYQFLGDLPQLADSPSASFKERLAPFLETRERQIAEMRVVFESTQRVWEELAEYLGEDPVDYLPFSIQAVPSGKEALDPNQILRHLSVFFASLQSAHSHLKSRVERERKRQERLDAAAVDGMISKRHSTPLFGDDKPVKVPRSRSKTYFGPDEKTPREALLESIRAVGSSRSDFLRASGSSSSLANSAPSSPLLSKAASSLSLPNTPTPSSPYSQASSIHSISLHINPANYEDIEFCEDCKFPKPHCLC